MRLGTVRQCQRIDELSQQAYDLSSEILMESAGCLASRELEQSYFPEISKGPIAVVCGPGNNGGDGFVVARHLHSRGHRDLTVFQLADQNRCSKLVQAQKKRAELQGLKVIDLVSNPSRLDDLASHTLIVDGLFGIGLSRPVEGEYLRLIDALNSSKGLKVSLDTPSGLHCDTGRVQGSTVRADMTLSFGLAKPGFFVGDGPHHVGRLRTLSIGFPFKALRATATTHFLFNERLARRYLPKRKNQTNKSDHGRLLVAAGSEGLWGAGILCSTSAYRMGVGYVFWVSTQAPTEELKQVPEVICSSWQAPRDWERSYDAVAIGPGLGLNSQTAEMLRQLKEHQKKAVVVDADAIQTCVEHALFPLPQDWVITPHTGELSRVLGWSVQEIQQDRFAAAKKASEVTGCHVLLKGFRSVIGYQDRCMVIHSGNSALAKAGTGDVLTGMIGALLAQGLETLQATATAAYIHGRLADEWVRSGHSKNSLMASDLKDHLPQLLSRLAQGALV